MSRARCGATSACGSAADGFDAIDEPPIATSDEAEAIGAGTDGGDDDLLRRMLAPLADARPDLAGPIDDLLAANPDDPKRLPGKLGRVGVALALVRQAVRALRKILSPDKTPIPVDSEPRVDDESETGEDSEFEATPEAEAREAPTPAVESPAAARRRAIAQGADRYVKVGDREYVRFEDGSYDFGHIDGSTADAIGRESAEIRLPKGEHDDTTGKGYGEVHIEKRHGLSIRQTKKTSDEQYADAADFVKDVAENFTKIHSSRDGHLFLVKKNGRARVAVIELTGDVSSSHWQVVSAGLYRPEFFKKSNRRLLWSRTGPSD